MGAECREGARVFDAAFAYATLALPQCVSYFVGLIIAEQPYNGHKNFYITVIRWGRGNGAFYHGMWISPGGRNWVGCERYFRIRSHEQMIWTFYKLCQLERRETVCTPHCIGNSLSVAPALRRSFSLHGAAPITDVSGYTSYFQASICLRAGLPSADQLESAADWNNDTDRDFFLEWGSWGTAGGSPGEWRLATYRQLRMSICRVGLPEFRPASPEDCSYVAQAARCGASLNTIELIDFNPEQPTPGPEFFVLSE